jgi:hypothetical protein
VVAQLQQRAIVNRAAEALRRRRTGIEAMEAGVRAEAYRVAATDRRCACMETARGSLLTAAIPEEASPELRRVVDRAWRAIEDGRPAHLSEHALGEFKFDDAEDDALVNEEIATRAGDPVISIILRDSEAMESQAAANSVVRRRCPGLVAAGVESIVPVATTSLEDPRPVDDTDRAPQAEQMEGVTTAAAEEGATATPQPEDEEVTPDGREDS